jgi:3-phenylpropionate/trans-cinnamate dioxygenase alpha subunit
MTITQLPSTEVGERHPGFECGNICRPEELSRNLDVSGLVDGRSGLVDRAIFTDRTLYEQELSRVFATSWLFLGHVEQLQKPGDFFTTYMGEDPVIVTKDKEGRIRAFLNSCRHRGARVLRADYGKTRNFTCTYHGWAWDLAGELISVPNEEGYAGSDLSRSPSSTRPSASSSPRGTPRPRRSTSSSVT